jgi:hypothetical protein
MNAKRMLASSCRQRILKTLSSKKEVAMMELIRAVRSGYNEVNRTLHILEREGIVSQQYISHKRIIRLNLTNRKTSALLKALKILEHANNSSATQFNFIGEFQLSFL